MTTTMHFGPEWMRTKHQPPSRPQPSVSPPPTSGAPPSGGSTYSALVSPAAPPQPDKRDETHPFRYTKEEMLRIYKEGGGRGGLGLEVERWDGVVREVGSEPVGLRDMGDAEKKLFAGPLNSELRRRQSTDYLSPIVTSHAGDRPRVSHNSSNTVSPMRERFGGLIGRKKDSTDPPLVTIPRKMSLTSNQPPLPSRETTLSSPRSRVGFGPSFDGVLNGAESWGARRRASEGLPKTGATLSSQGSHEDSEQRPDGKDPDIKEEEEENSEERLMSVQNDDLQTLQPNISGDASRLDTQPVQKDLVTSSVTSQTTSDLMSGAPLGIPDLASVEWSYLDPQGQVQGPFRADVMQKWYDEGYFSTELLMKRTNSDTDWTPVGDLARHAGGEKIFLFPPAPSLPPPGLAGRNDSLLQAVGHADQNGFNPSYQSASGRPLRASNLDTFFSNASNPSDSPSSSFGVGKYGSPDPSAFGGRADNPYPIVDPSAGSGIGGFPLISDPQPSFRRGSTFIDPEPEPSVGRTPSFGNIATGRGSSVDNYGSFDGGYPSNQLWSSGNTVGPNFDSMTSTETGSFSSNIGASVSNLASTNALLQPMAFNPRSHQESAFNDGGSGAGFNNSGYSIMTELTARRDTQQLNRPIMDDGMGGTTGFAYNYNDLRNAPLGGLQSQQHPTSSSIPHAPQQILRAPSTLSVLGQVSSSNSMQVANQDSSLTSSNVPQSPWDADPPTRRSGAFDTVHPIVKNTAIPQRSITPSPWTGTSQNSPSDSQVNESSPWFNASQNVLDNAWKDVSAPHSLTFSNVGQHNLQQEQTSVPLNSIPVPATSGLATQPLPPSSAMVPSALAAPKPAAPTTGSTKRRKANATQAQTPSVEVPSAPSTTGPSPQPAAGYVKPAWSNEDEAKKSKPSGIALGLREIQEAEAKKAEAKKVAERERERTTRNIAAPTAANEEVQPFTASWGLPTSQAGSVRNNNTQKDTPGGNQGTPNAPVWTTAGKPPSTKKTMKEIQEEEEKRKKFATKETVATAAARRAYAETMNKVGASAPSPGSAWTTVGSSGKPSPAVTNLSRPAISPSTSIVSVSGPSAAPRANGTTPPRSQLPPAAARSAPAPAKPDDHPAPPSHEFLKWLNESLNGLNSSVNVEEIMSMLLSFPMDPDASTTEIISDLIYASSTTLDGRRFATEFVSRRKMDAASRPKGALTGGGSGKVVSIADVVKAQPKATQPEWGGFKVVNKKKKGGRA